MKTPRFCWGVALGLLASSPSSQAADLPKAMDAAPCTSAPTIDGVIDAEEWRRRAGPRVRAEHDPDRSPGHGDTAL